MDWLYEFKCTVCGKQFDDFANNREVQQSKKSVQRSCPECNGKANLLPIQLATHGHNHSSWSVK